MLKIENTETYGWAAAIRGMRNPMNSWEQSDSGMWEVKCIGDELHRMYFEIGENDIELMRRLRKAGTDHRKFMRMITVSCDIVAPLYWWKEYDTYKVGTVANSCSTMHKIHANVFTLDDFSHEHLLDCDFEELPDEDMFVATEYFDGYIEYEETWDSMEVLKTTITALNLYRKRFIETKNKRYWWQMVQLLPTSYNQRRTIMLNYEVLANIYKSRRNHKLDEWHKFCEWVEGLPYSELIKGGADNA